MKLREIAARLDCVLSGGGEIEITGVAGMEHAAGGELTFLANPKYAHKVKHTRAAAILIAEPVPDAPLASLVSSNHYLDFARAPLVFPTGRRGPRPAFTGWHSSRKRRPSARAPRSGRSQWSASACASDAMPCCIRMLSFTKARASATIFWLIRTPLCANSARLETA